MSANINAKVKQIRINQLGIADGTISSLKYKSTIIAISILQEVISIAI